jgi:Protein of unknown function (DUF2695)
MPNILKYDARMPRYLHVALVNWLQSQISDPSECHGLKHTRAFLSRRPDLDPTGGRRDAALAWLVEHGGHCDCGVIMNTGNGSTTNPTMPATVH